MRNDKLLIVPALCIGAIVGAFAGRHHGRTEQKKVDEAECAKQRVDEYQQWISNISCPNSCTFTAPAPPAKPAKGSKRQTTSLETIDELDRIGAMHGLCWSKKKEEWFQCAPTPRRTPIRFCAGDIATCEKLAQPIPEKEPQP